MLVYCKHTQRERERERERESGGREGGRGEPSIFLFCFLVAIQHIQYRSHNRELLQGNKCQNGQPLEKSLVDLRVSLSLLSKRNRFRKSHDQSNTGQFSQQHTLCDSRQSDQRPRLPFNSLLTTWAYWFSPNNEPFKHTKVQ